VHDDDGEVRVLDAVDAHLPEDPKDTDLDGVVIGPNCLGRLVGVDGEPDATAVDELVMHDDPGSEDDAR
jgi:hypothetical protein